MTMAAVVGRHKREQQTGTREALRAGRQMETRWQRLMWRSAMETRSERRGRKIGASPTAAISS
ncbi:hypothetical protein TIFTF001_011644 [Ficus carica]|uniref:Uncharacterized protein n=1 Tax=Ficus carica TaxID=3494 RepID=A0AA88D0X9_FICCA|nr:hypothetical protein TIFTF001_011644 [Ficus carica]